MRCSVTPPAAQRGMRLRSRAVRLIERMLDAGVPGDRIGRTLHLSLEALEQVRCGTRALPLWRQMLVAALAEATSPNLRAQAAALRDQLRATLEFRAGMTIVHSDSPPSLP